MICMLQGHGSTIEDVVFKPGSKEQLASVGDDQCLLLWDTRSGNAPANRVVQVQLSSMLWTVITLSCWLLCSWMHTCFDCCMQAHGQHDLHTVDWCGLRDYMIATGEVA